MAAASAATTLGITNATIPQQRKKIFEFCAEKIRVNPSFICRSSTALGSGRVQRSPNGSNLSSELFGSKPVMGFSLPVVRFSQPVERLPSRRSFHAFKCVRMQVELENETASFLKNIAKIPPPAHLSILIKILQAKGEEIMNPNDRRGIIPLAIPLTKNLENDTITALLRWPTPPEGMEIPIVSVDKYGVKLLAKSVESYIHRVLAEEDFAIGKGGSENDKRVFADVAGEEGKNIYQPGDVFASGIPDINVYIMKKVGQFPDVFERLSLNHLSRGDVVSALVTGEFYATRKHFPGFARPFVFNSELLLKVGRKNEARDFAKIALKSPWWTLGSSFQDVAEVAGSGETLLEFAIEKISEEGEKEDLNKGKLPQQIALDQAAFVLDICSVHNLWDDKRIDLANLYEKAGLSEFANFVKSTA